MITYLSSWVVAGIKTSDNLPNYQVHTRLTQATETLRRKERRSAVRCACLRTCETTTGAVPRRAKRNEFWFSGLHYSLRRGVSSLAGGDRKRSKTQLHLLVRTAVSCGGDRQRLGGHAAADAARARTRVRATSASRRGIIITLLITSAKMESDR